MTTRVPFSPPSEPDEWVYTTAARIKCDSCGEWIYTRRHVTGTTLAFPPECRVCGAPVPAPTEGGDVT
jgi:ribosomal protein S27E